MELPWPELDWWKSRDWKNVQNKLDYLEKMHVRISPLRSLLFNSLRATSFDATTVCFLNSEPYEVGPLDYGTGQALSIPRGIGPSAYPRALTELFTELQADLSISIPPHGDLTRWSDQGVLLLNAIPSRREGVSVSHDWREYYNLTREIVARLQKKGIVFVFYGARTFTHRQTVIDGVNNRIIVNGKIKGSRLFSTINTYLVSIGLPPVDWRTDVPSTGSVSKETLQGSDVGRTVGRILDNTSGASLPFAEARSKA